MSDPDPVRAAQELLEHVPPDSDLARAARTRLQRAAREDLMTKITAPAGPAAAGKSVVGVTFDDDGVGHSSDASALAYFRRKGYGIGDEPPTYTPPDLTPRTEDGRVIDPREVQVAQVGSRLRDAAVDPHPGDFRAPHNAGQANPNGPEVYS